MAEFSNNTSFGTPHPDPNLDNWPDPNTGWPNVNTTYLAKNMLKVTADGSVVVLGKGRRTITTANAFQKMVKEANGGQSCWNDFIRQYTPSLDKPLYSTLLVGQWDTITQTGGDNVRLNGMFKTSTGIIAVGKHTGVPNEMPVSAVPSWGTNTFNNESAVVAYVKAPNIANPNDSPTLLTTGLNEQSTTPSFHFFPNPTDGAITILSENYEGKLEISLNNILGQNIYTQTVKATTEINLNFNTIPAGIYMIKLISEKGIKSGKLIVK